MADATALINASYPLVLYANLAAIVLALVGLRATFTRRLAPLHRSFPLLAMLIIGGFALRAVHGVQVDPLWSSGQELRIVAKGLLLNHELADCGWGSFAECDRPGPPGHPSGYSAMLAAWFSLFGVTLWSARAFSLFASTLAIPLAYITALLLWDDRRAAEGAALITTVLPWIVNFAGHGDLVPVTAPWVLLCVSALAQAVHTRSRGHQMLTVLIVCYAVHLSLENGLLLAILVLLPIVRRMLPFLVAALLVLPLIAWHLDIPGHFQPGDASSVTPLGMFTIEAFLRDVPAIVRGLIAPDSFGLIPLILVACALIGGRDRRGSTLALALLAAIYLVTYGAYWTEDVHEYLPLPFTLLAVLGGRGLVVLAGWTGDDDAGRTLAVVAMVLALSISYGRFSTVYPTLSTPEDLVAASSVASPDGYVMTSSCNGARALLFARDDVRAICSVYGLEVLESGLAERTDVHFLRSWECDAQDGFYLPKRDRYNLFCRSIERNFDMTFEGSHGDIMAYRLSPRPIGERYIPGS
ncbi:MAG: hypothetical protein QF415_10685 [Candidatus Undinarchaeales archaeon]|jgi:hypothetical protein|nr:hypothetical protein [Candidatus Undinarchaeales archaeon]MDP7494236.1 hypothetical protein [Candidatus Undinarchaeales archaeon]